MKNIQLTLLDILGLSLDILGLDNLALDIPGIAPLKFPTLVGEQKFHSWGRCTMAVTNMHSDLRFNSSSGLVLFHVRTCIVFPIPTIYFTSWGVRCIEGALTHFCLH